MSATINLEKKHFPVLLKELISILSPLYGGTFIDCTFGQGHYSKKILEFKENKIIALDRDKDVHPKSKLLKEKFKNRFQFYNIKFSQIKNLNLDTSYLKGIIFTGSVREILMRYIFDADTFLECDVREDYVKH